MIASEADLLRNALDRRLQVDPILALDPPKALSAAGDRPRTPSAPTLPPSTASSSPATGSAAPATASAARFATLPLGEVVGAHVVEVPAAGHVVAEIGSWRVAMAWPAGAGAEPAVGSAIGLRVLAHEPMLLFQRVASGDAMRTKGFEADPAARWSADALRLQGAATMRPTANASGLVTFDEPILELERELPRDAASPGRAAERTSAANSAVARSDGGASAPAASARDAASIAGSGWAIALEDVLVAREAAHVDGVATPLVPRAAEDSDRSVSPFVPLVLQGPAWQGQPVELVVRRERADEQFDNAALDRWCGELLIDLPRLGRIAGHVTWSMQGLRVRMEGDGDAAIAAMNDGAAALAAALAQVDLRVAALTVAGPAADQRQAGDAFTASPGMSFFRRSDG